MKPIFSARSAASSPSTSPEVFRPRISTVPESTVSSVPSRLRRVDFPQPDGPVIATVSPAVSSRSTPSRTITGSPPPGSGKALCRFVAVRIASFMGRPEGGKIRSE